MSSLRVGVAGLGFGAALHLPVLQSIPDVEVVGVCSRDPSAARLVADGFGVEHAVGSVTQLIGLGLDAIVLALPPDVNEQSVLEAAGAGCAILSEKPLASSHARAVHLVDAVRGATAAVDFEFAELTSFRTAREVIASGDLGHPLRAHVTWLTRSRAHETATWSWKMDRARGGGVLGLFGSQVVHLLERLVGPMASVTAVLDSRASARIAPPGADVAADAATMLLTAADGFHASVVVANAVVGVQRHEWQIVMERGAITIRNDELDPVRGFRCEVTDEHGRRTAAIESPRPGVDGRFEAVAAITRRFLDAVRSGKPALPSFDDAVRVQLILDAAVVSAASHHPVAV